MLQWGTTAVLFPTVVQGKPFDAWQAFLPVTFELSILLAAFGTVFGMFILNKLPRPYHPLDKHPDFRGVTDDKFFLSIEVADPKFDLARTEAFLTEMGGRNVAVVEE